MITDGGSGGGNPLPNPNGTPPYALTDAAEEALRMQATLDRVSQERDMWRARAERLAEQLRRLEKENANDP